VSTYKNETPLCQKFPCTFGTAYRHADIDVKTQREKSGGGSKR